MPGTLYNATADLLGGMKAVAYRIFVRFRWRPPQPMFNIMKIKEGKESLFEEFLEKSQKLSMKVKTPIGLGPFKNGEERIYIYVTHYHSTGAFLAVLGGLTITGLAFKRARATEHATWTYCEFSNAPALPDLEDVLIAGANDGDGFATFLGEHQAVIGAICSRIKDVRGKSLESYIVLGDTPEHQALLDAYQTQYEKLTIYRGRINSKVTS